MKSQKMLILIYLVFILCIIIQVQAHTIAVHPKEAAIYAHNMIGYCIRTHDTNQYDDRPEYPIAYVGNTHKDLDAKQSQRNDENIGKYHREKNRIDDIRILDKQGRPRRQSLNCQTPQEHCRCTASRNPQC